MLSGSNVHNGGGKDFSALFNGSAGNGSGGEETRDDGKTFVGMGAGNMLEFQFDRTKAPKGVSIDAVYSCSGHADGRASQNYTLYASKASAPDKFIKIAEVDFAGRKGLNEVSITSLKKEPIMKGMRNLRFVFRDGPQGFNVYREIAVAGEPNR